MEIIISQEFNIINDDIFNAKNFDLMILPQSVQGTIGESISFGLKNLKIKFDSKRMEFGEIRIIENKNLPFKLAFASSVNNNLSNQNIIFQIGEKIAELSKEYSKIVCPLFGSGAGGLVSLEAYKALKSGFESKNGKNLSMYIYDKKIFDNIITKRILITHPFLKEENKTLIEIEKSLPEFEFDYKFDLSGLITLKYETLSNQYKFWINLISETSLNLDTTTYLLEYCKKFNIKTIWIYLSENKDYHKLFSNFKIDYELDRLNIDELKNILYSKNEIIESNDFSDALPIHTEKLDNVDRLGRKPFAKAIVSFIKKLWTEDDKAFMMLLHGKWGSGKSNLVKFIDEEFSKSSEKWTSIHFNAWQYQHLEVPWWNLMEQVYEQSTKNKNLFTWICNKLFNSKNNKQNYKFSYFWRWIWILITEKCRRLKFKLVWSFVGISLLVFAISLWFPWLPEKIGIEPIDFKSFNIASLGSITATIISIISFIKAVYNKILNGSSESAETFEKLADNPKERITEHFNGLIKSIGTNVVIHIDDLDRCKSGYVVKLLEGIQTLFKKQKVLYIVTADRNWIVECFEMEYEDYQKTVKGKGQKLGELFLQKVFQLTTRIPNIPENIGNNFWNYLLTQKENTEIEVSDIYEVKKEIENSNNLNTLQNVISKHQQNPDIYNLAIEKLASDKKLETETEHSLLKYYSLLEPNPRALKTLINYYKIFRITTLSEMNNIDEEIQVKWLIIIMRWHKLAEYLSRNPDSIKYFEKTEACPEELKDYITDEEIKKIIIGDDKFKSKFTYNNLLQCLGVKN